VKRTPRPRWLVVVALVAANAGALAGGSPLASATIHHDGLSVGSFASAPSRAQRPAVLSGTSVRVDDSRVTRLNDLMTGSNTSDREFPSLAGPRLATESPGGGAWPVRVGQAGEAAVQAAYDIGPKATVQVGGRTRIVDGLTDGAVSEVKNVASQSYTQQFRDSLAYAQSTGRDFELDVGPDTCLTGPLRDAIADGLINLKFIP